MGFEIFNNEERILINNICEKENLSTLKKEDVESVLVFTSQVTDNDDMITNLVEGALSKLKSITVDEWNKMKMLIPLPVVESGEDIL